MQTFQAHLFDLDDTLVDTGSLHDKFTIKVGRDLGIELQAHDLRVTHGVTTEKGISLLAATSKVNSVDLATEIFRQRDKLLKDYIAEYGVPIKEGAKELLDILQESGAKIGLITSAKSARAESYLQHPVLCNRFEVVVTGDDAVSSDLSRIRGKPFAEFFWKASSRIKVEPQHCLVYGDAPADIEGAANADMHSIHIAEPSKISRLSIFASPSLVAVAEFLKLHLFRKLR